MATTGRQNEMPRVGPIEEGDSPVMQRLAGVFLALVALWGCGSPMPSGGHLVDGLWIKEETRCPDPSSGPCAAPVGDAARLALLAADPNAVITGASTAVPTCAPQFSSGLCVFAGLGRPVVVVFDLADGSRKAVGLLCGSEANGLQTCSPLDFRSSRSS